MMERSTWVSAAKWTTSSQPFMALSTAFGSQMSAFSHWWRDLMSARFAGLPA